MSLFRNSLSCSKNYPRDINHMPAVIFFVFLDLRKNNYSRTASLCPSINGLFAQYLRSA